LTAGPSKRPETVKDELRISIGFGRCAVNQVITGFELDDELVTLDVGPAMTSILEDQPP
jgi:hypothetical protein